MIQIETITINGREFVRTYSDGGYRIRQDGTGVIYDEAVDPVGTGRTYTETDEPVETEEMTEEAQWAEAGRILMGVSE